MHELTIRIAAEMKAEIARVAVCGCRDGGLYATIQRLWGITNDFS
jgi:hypothetical protein